MMREKAVLPHLTWRDERAVPEAREKRGWMRTNVSRLRELMRNGAR
jgi:hypothetical protein